MPWHRVDWWGWHMAWMWIGGLLLLIVLVLLVRWLAFTSTPGGGSPRDPAEEALRLRYARGEIEQDEFDRRLADLRRAR